MVHGRRATLDSVHPDVEGGRLVAATIRADGHVGIGACDPLERGDPRIWAAGVIYTVGSINFLFDKSQPPHLRADKLAEHVGVVQSTMVNKSARIRSLLRLSWYEPELTR